MDMAKQRSKKRLNPLPSNWRSRLEIVSSDIDWFGRKALLIELKFQKSKTPKGLNTYIGSITIDKNQGYVHDSEIVERLQGRKLGIMLYENALKQNGVISTSFHTASEQAQRVWKSLCKRYEYSSDFFKGILVVYNKPKNQ